MILFKLWPRQWRLPSWTDVREWFRRPIRVVEIDERPKVLKPRRLYVTRHAEGPAFGFLLCPCGCRETVHLRFMGERRPRWSLESRAGRATVFPSVWRQSGCRSHFFIRVGRIDWC